MSEEKVKGKPKREIPKRVNERTMIGLIPARTFIKILPLYIITIIVTMNKFSPVALTLGTAAMGGITYLFSEIKYKESGFDILKDILRYSKEGDIHFERSCVLRDANERFVNNKIKKRN